MTEAELIDIMNSDFKLWEKAVTSENGNNLTKAITLPYGIGTVSLTFDGVKDAAARREACEIWGDYIRKEIDNAIGDKAVTARAKQAAALRKPAPSRPSSPEPVEESEESASEGPVSALESFAAGASGAIDKLESIRASISMTQKRLELLVKEERALSAYVEIINAQENEDQANQYSDAED